ncbi:hypothetical protein AB0B50_14155 [Streptomyces sp. NPDC041068]|uniref:LppU/SCO3897 family protein n=1 Tax=Streptomyces sp. NPDC041068 TaxID=3155130 RepID=UPI0033DC83E3
MSEPIPPAPRPGRAPKPRVRGFLAVLGAVGAAIVAGLLSQGDDGDSSASPAPTFSMGTYAPSTDTPYPNDPYSNDPYSSDPYATATDDPMATPSSPAPSPYEQGTCLNGTLPDSETAQEVSGVDEVSCSASDAHYRVIQTIPLTSDLSQCKNNSQTQYAFSYRYTLNGSTVNEYVYCLVGLGSYAR